VNLRIVFVEDSADDVALMLRRLREAGIEPHWERVQTEDALREALAGERWELALVDYNLPGFGGLKALAVLAAEAPDVPAITVSGAITEETAVATITAGAVDYVLKDNLTRLAPAVRRAVEGAELRRQQRRAAEQARILAVADVVEAMSSHRPYRAALGMAAALAEVRAHAGVKYDGDVAAACVRLVEEQGFQFTP
jgi:putative two-component system response regulator